VTTYRSSLLAGVAGLLFGAAAMGLNSSTAADPLPEGIYELRTYTAAEGKLADLEARFKNHTVKLFEKHGMKNVLYWKPTDPAKADNTLIYLLWHKSEDAAKASWDAFQKDPDWIAAKTASEKDGPLTAKGGVQRMYLKTTEWSPKAH
jgi:hypothetical protein